MSFYLVLLVTSILAGLLAVACVRSRLGDKDYRVFVLGALTNIVAVIGTWYFAAYIKKRRMKS